MYNEREPTTDEAMGMAWWNSLSVESRTKWATKAGTGVVADAWTAFKTDANLNANLDDFWRAVSPTEPVVR